MPFGGNWEVSRAVVRPNVVLKYRANDSECTLVKYTIENCNFKTIRYVL